VAKRQLEDHVKFVGQISDQKILVSEYQNADVFVFASHMQTWGIAVFEALATGLPVVLSRTAGASEVLTEGENVFLADPGRPGTYARAIEELAINPPLYQKISRTGSDFVRRVITWENYAKGLLGLFEESLREAQKRAK
jgi:glycosyltransferase involved in cell wall biosynthesis